MIITLYRILIADDEAIMLESMKMTIKQMLDNNCEIMLAKSGRTVIEISESFQPDIVFMDIQMPGINGIEAMREIRNSNRSVIFIVVTAYDKFTYAREALGLGVYEYLTKPVMKRTLMDCVNKAIKEVDIRHEKRIQELKIKEKLEIVVPIIESGFIYTMLIEDDYNGEKEHYRDLLSIDTDYGFCMILELGDSILEGHLTNTVGAGMKAQKQYKVIRSIIKEHFNCICGAIMSNRIVICIPYNTAEMVYEERVEVISKARNMIIQLSKKIDLSFKVGIGGVKEFQHLFESYKGAGKALQKGNRKVAHIDDLETECLYEDTYPVELEKKLFKAVENGDSLLAKANADEFYKWMVNTYPDSEMDIKLKVIEFILISEKNAFEQGDLKYTFKYRSNYLSQVLGMKCDDNLRQWFLDKIVIACNYVKNSQERHNEGIVDKAKKYIEDNYMHNISLEDVSRSISVTPYYFSKVFKEETNTTFIEYLGNLRINKAKRMLLSSNLSMKEICRETGYKDPNYFSRIFKKVEGRTPSEYREQLQEV